MLRFPIFGFPVTIHWMFWLFAALLGGASGAHGPDELLNVLVWVVVLLISVLWHELGHAFVMRRFGDRNVEIVIHGLGGYAAGRAWRSRNEQIIISAAGPAAGFVLCLLAWLISKSIDMYSLPYLLRSAINALFWVNLILNVINLLPVIPLDGGKISQAVLADKGLLAYRISLVFAAAAGIYFGTHGQFFAALLFASLAVDSWRAMNNQPPTNIFGQQ